MAIPELAIDTVTVVIRGHFDVAVLSPKNLVEQGLIDSSELADAEQSSRITTFRYLRRRE
jgi:hypothetical protein